MLLWLQFTRINSGTIIFPQQRNFPTSLHCLTYQYCTLYLYPLVERYFLLCHFKELHIVYTSFDHLFHPLLQVNITFNVRSLYLSCTKRKKVHETFQGRRFRYGFPFIFSPFAQTHPILCSAATIQLTLIYPYHSRPKKIEMNLSGVSVCALNK